MCGGIFGIGGISNSVIPGYSVTLPPLDFNAWRGTGRGTIRSFGLENQYVQLPNGYPPESYFLANNPCLMKSNPLLLGVFDLTQGGCFC